MEYQRNPLSGSPLFLIVSSQFLCGVKLCHQNVTKKLVHKKTVNHLGSQGEEIEKLETHKKHKAHTIEINKRQSFVGKKTTSKKAHNHHRVSTP